MFRSRSFSAKSFSPTSFRFDTAEVPEQSAGGGGGRDLFDDEQVVKSNALIIATVLSMVASGELQWRH